MPDEPREGEGHEHTTGAGTTPARRIIRSGGVDEPSELLGPQEDDARGQGPAIRGLHETGEATTAVDDEPARRKPRGRRGS